MKATVPLALAAVMLVAMASGCLNWGSGSENGVNGEFLLVEDGTVLDAATCSSRGLAGQVTVFHSAACGACLRTVPVLEEIELETDTAFEFIDVSSDTERMQELKLSPTHIPAVIIGCKVYVGYRTKEQFLELIG
jgi:hypothetical protein